MAKDEKTYCFWHMWTARLEGFVVGIIFLAAISGLLTPASRAPACAPRLPDNFPPASCSVQGDDSCCATQSYGNYTNTVCIYGPHANPASITQALNVTRNASVDGWSPCPPNTTYRALPDRITCDNRTGACSDDLVFRWECD